MCQISVDLPSINESSAGGYQLRVGRDGALALLAVAVLGREHQLRLLAQRHLHHPLVLRPAFFKGSTRFFKGLTDFALIFQYMYQ